MKHSPVDPETGHWTVPHFARNHSDTPCICGYVFSEDETVCDVYYGIKDVSHEEGSEEWYDSLEHPSISTARGNAKLIAYSPLMYEMLVCIYIAMSNGNDDESKLFEMNLWAKDIEKMLKEMEE